ncbi:MAG: hypothetical protein WCZ66_01095 [Sphingomonadaceae bacterium]
MMPVIILDRHSRLSLKLAAFVDCALPVNLPCSAYANSCGRRFCMNDEPNRTEIAPDSTFFRSGRAKTPDKLLRAICGCATRYGVNGVEKDYPNR